jgi:creatinine amidohydrolase
MKLEDMSWDEAVRKVKGKIILVPHGSTEEHGYHLPLKTDALIAERICAAFYYSSSIVVTPVMDYTALRATKAMPGTVGPNEREYTKWIETVIIDFLKLKPKRVVFFLAHDGGTQKRVFSKMKEKFKSKLDYISASKLGHQAVEEGIVETGGHAGEGETSLMLLFDPKTVRMSRAIDEYWPEGGISKSGVNGHPTKATKSKGKALSQFYIRMLKERLI